jgi:hypothetical protein
MREALGLIPSTTKKKERWKLKPSTSFRDPINMGRGSRKEKNLKEKGKNFM